MSRIKKEAFVLIFILFVSLNTAYADEVGCCSNPGAGPLTCSTDRLALRDKECCPKPEASFPGYYKSSQNPDGPTNSNECAANFFFLNKACTDTTITACALGCCCSELGGAIAAEAQCKGTGLTFHKGQTNCNALCPVPQCNDGFDNDNNGCADFEGGDLGCTSPADNAESGGSCVTEGAGCSNPSYIPKLSNLEITPFKGQAKFLLKWKDECSETAVSYDVLRCKNSGCTNFALVGTTNTDSFEDASGDLLFDATYTYQIKARYNLQIANPTITKAATLGSIECMEQFSSNNFCIHNSYYNRYRNYLLANFPEIFLKDFSLGIKNKFGDRLNKAFSCDTVNKLIPEGTSCSSTQICVVNNNKPSCLSKISCNYNNANPFGLYYTLDACENDRYCFYDKSHSTVDSCFACDTSMACYDYKTEEACSRDNCRIGNCKWKSLANQIGIGACVSTSEYNCQWCEKKGTASLENLRAFNEVFDFCTREKSNTLSEESFKCYFRNGKSKNCDDVICRDYDAEQCSNAQITHDQNNRISNPSIDECGIKVCQNINNACVKNADGDNNADCTATLCERDYFAPNTTLLQITKKGVVDSLIVQVYDKTSINSSFILKTSPDYITFLCAEPCGAIGHPYNATLASRVVIITNLNAFDGSNGNKLLSLSEGINVVRYYSQDPAKNLGEVKKITIEAHDKTDGPRIFSINITDGTKVLDKLYTSNQKPAIEVQFLEPAIVTHSRLVNKKTGLIVPLQGNTELSTKVSFSIAETLPNGEYVFELNAKNNNNIFMDPTLSQIIVIDNNKPILNIIPSSGTVLNMSIVTIKLTFDKEVNLETVKINSEDIKSSFSTIDNKVFTATINLIDGNKKLEISARDFAKNQVTGSALFIVDANPAIISLISPRFGTASRSVFDVIVETDNDAVCRFSLDNNFEFDFMEPFTTTGATTHTISNFNRIASGDTTTHKLNIRCKDQRGFPFKSFDINVDTSSPLIKSAFAFPNPIIEKPSITTLTIEADEPVICKFSANSKEFEIMEGKFDGFDDNAFKIINRKQITLDNEGNFLYFVVCKNKAELNSDIKEIPFKVDLTIPIKITSHTPEFFNSTKVILAIETNKISQCKFSETDQTAQNGEIFGAPSYTHTRQVISTHGTHTFYIVCKDQFLEKFSDVATISFTVDISPPSMRYVNDTSTFELFPEKTCLTDRLRVKFLGEDQESIVKEYFYTLIRKLDNKQIIGFVKSFIGGEWIWVENLNLDDNTQYFFGVKAKNVVGLESNAKNSDGITVDISACQPKPVCGDSIINQQGEQCDKETFGLINSCTQYTNFIGGTLRCTNNCKLDTSECIKVPTCGNNLIDPGESCDGNSFGQIKSCTDYSTSFSGGTFRCTPTCQLDTSACTEAPKCGNKAIDKGESCDGINLGPLTGRCFDYNPSTFTDGNLSCNNCKLDTSKCQGVQGSCGDGVVNIGETCDGNSFGQIKTCTDYDNSFSGGTLKCSNCKLDTSSCVEKPRCGNSVIDKGESCDGTNIGPLSGKCLDYSVDFSSGNLKCTNDCKLDTLGCTKAQECGNNRLDTGELCDGSNFGSINDLSCRSYSIDFISGTLSCKNCKISTDNCVHKPTSTCGDNSINQPGEECDKETFGLINRCTQYTNFIGGTLKCTNNCKLDTLGCTKLPACGNSELDPSESCDGNSFGQIKTCTDYDKSFSGGTLKCTSTCQLDTSACTEAPKCGNVKIDLGESCDGINLGPLTGRCFDYNPSTFTDGNLSCNNCKLDTSKCQGLQGTCGDGVVNIGESCDGSSFGQIKSCTDYDKSFSGGTLRCTSTCQLDTSACTEAPKCGNSFIDKGESCDTNNLGLPNNKCIDYSTFFDGGTLKCKSDCSLDTSGCTKAPGCGNNRLDTGELCDGTNFGNFRDLSCDGYSSNFINGTLKCINCKISTNDCKSNQTTVSLIRCKDRGDCHLDEPCTDNSDCESRFCFSNKCSGSSCEDGIKNQGESVVDCGGPCLKCQNNQVCNINNDCESGYCRFGFCKPQESCFNGILSPGESDVDCGGYCPTKCLEGSSCNLNEDCGEGLQCISSACKICSENDRNCNGVPDDQESGIKDSDNDGLPDDWEIQNGLNPNDPNDAGLDSDNDGLTNLEEFNVVKTYGKSTNPNLADTDDDKFTDKEEVDKGTNPVNPDDFPKSNFITIMLYIVGITVLISGFGYLAYRVVQKRKERKIGMPRQREAPKFAPQQPIKQVQQRQREEEIRIRESLKRKEEQKAKERESLFGKFIEGKETAKEEPKGIKAEQKVVKEEKKPVQETKKGERKVPAKAKKTKTLTKKPKEDIFIRLKQIAKESRKKRSTMRKNAKK